MVRGFLAFLLVLALGALGLSLLPFDWVKPTVDTMAMDGRVEAFDRPFFEALTARLRILSLCLFGTAGFFFVRREALDRQWEGAHREFAFTQVELSRDLGRDVRTLLHDQAGFLGLCVIAALVLRVMNLEAPVRADEAYSFLYYSSTPLWVTLSVYTPNNHVFYNVVVKAFLALGDHLFLLRMPSLLVGLALIPLGALWASKLVSLSAARWVAVLMACHPLLLHYSTQGRGYVLMMGFMMGAWVLVQYKQGLAARFWMGLCFLLAFWTLPTTLYGFLGVGLFVFVTRSMPLAKAFGFGAYVATLVLVLYAPILFVGGWEALAGNEYSAPKSWAVSVKLFGGLLKGLPEYMMMGWTPWLSLVGVLGWVRLPRKARVFTACVIGVTLGVILLQRVHPYPRILLFLLPFLFLGMGALVPARAKVLAPVVLVLLTAWSLWKVPQSRLQEGGLFPEAQAVAQYMANQDLSRTKLALQTPSFAPLHFYFKQMELPGQAFFLQDYDRVLAVINGAALQDLPTVLSAIPEGVEHLGNPELIETIGQTQIFELRRMNK